VTTSSNCIEQSAAADKVELGKKLIAEFDGIRSAALAGDRDSIQKLIHAYKRGAGTDPDQVKAFEWQRCAVELNPPMETIYVDLALAYRDGIGTPVNLPKFWEFMEKAAATAAGAEGMFQLIQAYADEQGIFGKVSLEEADKWTIKMAETNAAGAMIVLARAFKTGKDVTKDINKFHDWATKAVNAAEEAKKIGLAAEQARAEPGSLTAEQYKDDWADEDLPLALAELIDAKKSLNLNAEVIEVMERAVVAADEAIQRAIGRQMRIAPDVMAIMVRHVKQIEPPSKNAGDYPEGQYFKWLNKIGKVAEFASVNQLDLLDDDELISFMYKLAAIYRTGIITKKNKALYAKWLEFAAKYHNVDALYDLAKLKGQDDPHYQSHIDRAAKFGNVYAFIVRSLNKCELSPRTNKKLVTLLKNLTDKVSEIKRTRHVISSEVEPKVAHYTNQGALNSMLAVNEPSKRNVMRLGNIVYVNDPDEGKRLIDKKMEDRDNPFAKFFPSDDPNESIPWKDLEGSDFFVHVGSFSLITDRLDLWRAYGGDGNGFCVVTPMSVFLAPEKKPVMSGGWTSRTDKAAEVVLYKVFYSDKDVDETLAVLTPILAKIIQSTPKEKFPAVAGIVRMLLSELLYLYKRDEYSSEREARVITTQKLASSDLIRHDTETGSRLFIETSPIFFETEGSKIIIGPRVPDKGAAMINIRHRLAVQKWDDGICEVSHSKTRYR
jgi:TPR repeat protein